MNAPRVVFMGSPAFAVPSLTVLAERPDLCEVVAVVTQPDKPAGRGRKLTPCAVKIAAQARRIPVLEPTKMKIAATREAIAEFKPDFLIVAAYGRILPQAILDIPTIAPVNVHASLLPRHRGASPIAHVIIDGDAEAGVSIMKMEAGLDTGPVYSTRAIPRPEEATCGQLTIKLAELGAHLLADTLPKIADGSLSPTPQDDSLSTYAPMFEKADGELDFALPASTLARRVLGLSPWPGAFTHLNQQRVQVLRARGLPENTPGEPGDVVRADKNGILVVCGEGALEVTEVKPAGKKAMLASSWVAGRGVSHGDRFESKTS